jgi:hypothetical protein
LLRGGSVCRRPLWWYVDVERKKKPTKGPNNDTTSFGPCCPEVAVRRGGKRLPV